MSGKASDLAADCKQRAKYPVCTVQVHKNTPINFLSSRKRQKHRVPFNFWKEIYIYFILNIFFKFDHFFSQEVWAVWAEEEEKKI